MTDVPPDTDSFTPEEYNQCVLAQLKFPFGCKEVITAVKRRKSHNNDKPIGISNENPLLDTRLLVLELPDGAVEEKSANDIVENI